MPADAAFWDNLAEDYAAKPVEDPAAFDRKIAFTTELMRADHTVLDIGCGTGSLALRLAPHGAHIHGLDVSSEMVRIARAKADAAGASNVTFHVGAFDPSFEPFADESLDGICAYSILHLVDDLDATLAQIFRLLKPGGYLVSSTVCLGESYAPYRPLLAVMRWLGKAPMVTIISKPQLAEAMTRAGFEPPSQPDVGAKSTIGFMVTRKPALV